MMHAVITCLPVEPLHMDRQNIVNRIQFMERELKEVEQTLRQSTTAELLKEHAAVKAAIYELYTQLTEYDLK